MRRVDYSKSVIGCWDHSSESLSELLELCEDGTFNTLGERGDEVFGDLMIHIFPKESVVEGVENVIETINVSLVFKAAK